jgi:hypothetical protein
VVRFERVGGASGIIGVAAIATQFVLVGAAAPDAQALLSGRTRWHWATLLRIVGGLSLVWFTSGLAARLRRLGSHSVSSAATIVSGAGLLWGAVWLVSALFNSVAISLAETSNAAPMARFLAVLAIQSLLVLTPVLTMAFLTATGVAVLAAPTFPRRFGYMALAAAAGRLVMAIVDWYGIADIAMRIMDLSLMWVVVTSIHLLGATTPASGPALATGSTRQ